jgi:hypothetical protein
MRCPWRTEGSADARIADAGAALHAAAQRRCCLTATRRLLAMEGQGTAWQDKQQHDDQGGTEHACSI